MIYNSITAEYVLWINYLAPALSPLISYPDVNIADADADADIDDDAAAADDDDDADDGSSHAHIYFWRKKVQQ